MDPYLELALLVKAGQREFERMGNEAMRPLGLTAAQADALSVIAQTGPITLKDLGGLLIAEAGHPSRLVDRLVEAGLVDRAPAAGDRRRVILSATTAGKRLNRRVVAARSQLLEFGRALIGEDDLEHTLVVLRRLSEHSTYAELLARRRALGEGGD